MPDHSSFCNYFTTAPYLLSLNNIGTSSINDLKIYLLRCYYFQMLYIRIKTPNPFYRAFNNEWVSEYLQILRYLLNKQYLVLAQMSLLLTLQLCSTFNASFIPLTIGTGPWRSIKTQMQSISSLSYKLFSEGKIVLQVEIALSLVMKYPHFIQNIVIERTW